MAINFKFQATKISDIEIWVTLYTHTCMLSWFSHVCLFAILWTIPHQVPMSMGFPRQEYWSGLPWPPPGDLPDQGIEALLHWLAGSLPLLLLLLSHFSRVWLCNRVDGSPPGSSVPAVLQARILEWVAISFFNACMHAKLLQLCPTLYNPMNSSPPGSSVHRIL